METQISYYAVIPANIRYDSELPPNAKLLYGEITALCNKEGYCWASNSYFAKLYNVSVRSISAWINILCNRGYIESKVIRKNKSKEVEVRCITIREGTLWKKSSYPIEENFLPYRKNLLYPIEENFQENITSINTTKNNTSNKKKKERKKSGYDEILSSIEDTSLRELYLDYIKMRKLIKSPMTDRALQMLINKVESLETDVERQKLLLETAIINNWKSVYPLKGANNAVTERTGGEVQYGTVL